jgi:hypothetical protein
VEDILGMDYMFKEFERTVQELSYLETLSFDTLFKVYQQALLRDNERPLTNFDVEQRDVYMKLKFKAFRNNPNPLNPPFEEEKKAAEYDPQNLDSSKLYSMIQALDSKILASLHSNQCAERFERFEKAL